MRPAYKLPRGDVRRVRKGQAEMLEWFPRLIIMAVAIVVIALLVRYYSNRDIEAGNVTVAAHQYRLYYGNTIMWQDNMTGRIYPGVVDMSKFTDARLAETFDSRARLSSCLTAASAACPQLAKTICFNKAVFQEYSATASLSGAGGATVQTVTYPVTLRHEERSCPGSLNITIVRPNR